AILAILASLAFGWLHFVENARVTLTENRVHTLGVEAASVTGLKGFPPAALEDLAPRLERAIPMKDGKFVDAWDRPFEYRVEGKKFRLWSCGPDGVSGTADDLHYVRN